MDIRDIKKYQSVQMQLLVETDRICQELGICYYMIGGTLLGAVRHGGFIPWDADIDIAMPRHDYEEFRSYWEKENSNKYFYQHFTTDPNHLSPHAVLRIRGTHVVMNSRISQTYPQKEDGIYLDIFQLDEPPMEKKKQMKQMKRIKRIRRLIELKAAYIYLETSKAKKYIKRVISVLIPISLTTLNKSLDNEMKKYSGSGSEYLVSMASHYSYWKQLMPKSIYGEPQRIVFEGKQFCAPADTVAYLTQIYGDYMKLPPVEKRYSDLDNIDFIDYGVGDIMA